MTTATPTKTFDVDEVFPETDTNMLGGMSFRDFLIRAVVAAVLIGAAILGALSAAKAFGLFPQTTVVSSTGAVIAPASVPGRSAEIASTINYKWAEIAGPNGTRLYTQCEYNVPGSRIVMSQSGQFEYRPDKNCK